MGTYRVGMLGVGPRGLKQARAYMAHPRTELAALSDVDPERLAKASAEFGGVSRDHRDATRHPPSDSDDASVSGCGAHDQCR